jgi:hypothetical protein
MQSIMPRTRTAFRAIGGFIAVLLFSFNRFKFLTLIFTIYDKETQLPTGPFFPFHGTRWGESQVHKKLLPESPEEGAFFEHSS